MENINMKYNDYIEYNSYGDKILAKFVVYRPDKDTIVIDHEGRLQELDTSEVNLASNEIIHNFFNQKITKCDRNIKTLNKNISNSILYKEACKLKLDIEIAKKEKLNIELENKQLMLKLLENEKTKNVSNILSEITGLLYNIQQYDKVISNTNTNLNGALNSIDMYEKNIKSWEYEKKEYENQYNNWKGMIKNED